MICPRIALENSVNFPLIVALVWLTFWLINCTEEIVVFKQVVLGEVKGHLQVITLNNPRKLNIISRKVVN